MSAKFRCHSAANRGFASEFPLPPTLLKLDQDADFERVSWPEFGYFEHSSTFFPCRQGNSDALVIAGPGRAHCGRP